MASMTSMKLILGKGNNPPFPFLVIESGRPVALKLGIGKGDYFCIGYCIFYDYLL